MRFGRRPRGISSAQRPYAASRTASSSSVRRVDAPVQAWSTCSTVLTPTIGVSAGTPGQPREGDLAGRSPRASATAVSAARRRSLPGCRYSVSQWAVVPVVSAPAASRCRPSLSTAGCAGGSQAVADSMPSGIGWPSTATAGGLVGRSSAAGTRSVAGVRRVRPRPGSVRPARTGGSTRPSERSGRHGPGRRTSPPGPPSERSDPPRAPSTGPHLSTPSRCKLASMLRARCPAQPFEVVGEPSDPRRLGADLGAQSHADAGVGRQPAARAAPRSGRRSPVSEVQKL